MLLFPPAVDGPEVETLCGSAGRGEVVSSGSQLFLQLHTNDHIAGSGFYATYQLIDNGKYITVYRTDV